MDAVPGVPGGKLTGGRKVVVDAQSHVVALVGSGCAAEEVIDAGVLVSGEVGLWIVFGNCLGNCILAADGDFVVLKRRADVVAGRGRIGPGGLRIVDGDQRAGSIEGLRKIALLLQVGRHGVEGLREGIFEEALPVVEEEGFLVHDGAAESYAVLILIKRGDRLAGLLGEVIIGVEDVVLNELPHVAVVFIGSAAADVIDEAAGGTAVFGIGVVGDDERFFGCIGRGDKGRAAAGLIFICGAVHLKVVRGGVSAAELHAAIGIGGGLEGAEAAEGANAGNEIDETVVVSAVEGKIDDGVLFNVGANQSGFLIESHGRRAYFHGGLRCAYLQ